MSGPHGPADYPYPLQRPAPAAPTDDVPRDMDHPAWCDREHCTPTRHLRLTTVAGGQADTRLVVEDALDIPLVTVERRNHACQIHTEGAMTWPLDEARRVYVALGEMLAQLSGGES